MVGDGVGHVRMMPAVLSGGGGVSEGPPEKVTMSRHPTTVREQSCADIWVRGRGNSKCQSRPCDSQFLF